VVESGGRSLLEQCEACNARIPDGAEWCGLCLTRVPRGPKNPAHPLAVAAPPPVARAGSRTREGALTFGIKGRLVITILVGVVGAVGLSLFLIPYFTSHSHTVLAYAAVFLVPYSFVAWLILRDVWKRSWQPLEVLQERPWRPPGASA
jgi:hypothetical protein